MIFNEQNNFWDNFGLPTLVCKFWNLEKSIFRKNYHFIWILQQIWYDYVVKKFPKQK